MPPNTNFMGVKARFVELETIWQAITEATPKKPISIATVNPEFILEAQRNPEFKKALAEMDYCIVDGSGLAIALNLAQKAGFKVAAPPKLAGADLVEMILEKGHVRPFLLGGLEGEAKAAGKVWQEKYPQLSLAGAESGGVITASDNPDPSLLEMINKSRPEVLFVGFGAPKQELWIHKAKPLLEVPVLIGVGGTFGFYTTKKRAPLWMRSLSLEWLYRGLTEPGHLPRLFKATVIFPLKALFWILTSPKG